MQLLWVHTISIISERQAYIVVYHCFVYPYLFSTHIRIISVIWSGRKVNKSRILRKKGIIKKVNTFKTCLHWECLIPVKMPDSNSQSYLNTYVTHNTALSGSHTHTMSPPNISLAVLELYGIAVPHFITVLCFVKEMFVQYCIVGSQFCTYGNPTTLQRHTAN